MVAGAQGADVGKAQKAIITRGIHEGLIPPIAESHSHGVILRASGGPVIAGIEMWHFPCIIGALVIIGSPAFAGDDGGRLWV